MAIYTLADLYVPPRRSSSIPRQYHSMAAAGRQDHHFSLADAVDLKPKLQALDKALAGICNGHSRELDFTSIDDAVSMQPPHVAVYVDGSEEFFLMLKTVSRPDLIPKVLAEAIKAMSHGRPYVNMHRTSDFKKGADPTFSDFRPMLPDIDRLCGTDLAGVVARLEAQGKLRVPSREQLRACTDMAQSRLFPFCNFQLSSACKCTRTFCRSTLAVFSRPGVAKVMADALLSCAPTSKCTVKCGNITMRM